MQRAPENGRAFSQLYRRSGKRPRDAQVNAANVLVQSYSARVEWEGGPPCRERRAWAGGSSAENGPCSFVVGLEN